MPTDGKWASTTIGEMANFTKAFDRHIAGHICQTFSLYRCFTSHKFYNEVAMTVLCTLLKYIYCSYTHMHKG